MQDDEPGATDDDLGPDHIRVIDAFKMPRLHFSNERRAFEKASGKPGILGSADAKAQYMRDRFSIIKQVISRSEHFLPPAVAGHDRDTYLQVRRTWYKLDSCPSASRSRASRTYWADKAAASCCSGS